MMEWTDSFNKRRSTRTGTLVQKRPLTFGVSPDLMNGTDCFAAIALELEQLFTGGRTAVAFTLVLALLENPGVSLVRYFCQDEQIIATERIA